jgi:hypothetical protein
LPYLCKWHALEQNGEELRKIECDIQPDQDLYNNIDSTGLDRRKESLILKQKRSLCWPNEGTVQQFMNPS